MKRKYFFVIFIILALFQLGVPLSMAWRWEMVLREGQPFYWESAPVDPYDAFKGRYLALSFKENSGLLAPHSLNVKTGQMVYAVLGTDDKGLTVIKEVSVREPLGQTYIKAEFLYKNKDNKAQIRLPFNRYYLPEELAGEAEAQLLQQAGKNKKNAVVLVRIKDGYGVIENIYFDDMGLVQYLREDKS